MVYGLHHTGQCRRAAGSFVLFTGVGAGEAERCGQRRPHLEIGALAGGRRVNSRRGAVREVLEVQPEHVEGAQHRCDCAPLHQPLDFAVA